MPITLGFSEGKELATVRASAQTVNIARRQVIIEVIIPKE
jgi:hypothetical protein